MGVFQPSPTSRPLPSGLPHARGGVPCTTAVFTARVGAPVPADLHIRIQEACERTSVAIQNLLYVIVSHFVTDNAFADYLIDKAIARKVATAEDSLKGLTR